MQYRTMTLDDYEKVYDLWLHTPGMGLNRQDDSREGIGRYLSRNPNTCFVAEQDGRIVGAIMSGHDGRRGIIYHTAVAVDQRGKGIGRLLAEYALEALKEEGIKKVALVAFSGNKIGNGFWERMGFTERTDLTYRNRQLCEMERIDT